VQVIVLYTVARPKMQVEVVEIRGFTFLSIK
jgi:hypothetical protein